MKMIHETHEKHKKIKKNLCNLRNLWFLLFHRFEVRPESRIMSDCPLSYHTGWDWLQTGFR
jgi:hypothetical protein